MLVDLFPGQQVALDEAYETSLAGIPEGQPKTDGIAAGEQVGVGFLDLPAIGGLNSTVSYVQPPPGPGVYERVNELAATLDRTVYHLFGTRMAVYSKQDFVARVPPDNFASMPSV